MADAHAGLFPVSTHELAAMLDATLVGAGDVVVTGLAGLADAGPGDVSFLRSSKLAAQCASTRAGAIIVSAGALNGHVPDVPVLTVPDADLAVIALLERLAPCRTHTPGIDGRATVHPSAQVHPSASVGPGCVIGQNVRIGADTVLHAGVVVERDCVIGQRCDIQANAVVGSDGFGYHFDTNRGTLVKVPHVGNVVIEDDVDIGACSCIDRGKFGSTVIGAGTKIDNLVQVAHNSVVGKGCILCGQVGIAGSVRLGDRVTIGGGVSVRDNVVVGDGVSITGRAAVADDIPAGQIWGGAPAGPATEQHRRTVALAFVADHFADIRRLVAAHKEQRTVDR